MLGEKLKELRGDLPIILDNETCVYCGMPLYPGSHTKEHVIGRCFVPKGKLNGQWNLIVRAHKSCNEKKADLENDISAISMQADAWGLYASPDEILVKEAKRKGENCISRLTRKPVKESLANLKIKVPFAPGVEFSFDLISPPQILSDRMFDLARLQIMAFFYFVTYNKETRRGGFWLGSFFPILESPPTDWGNPLHRAFMDAVVTWEPRFFGISADEFFKVIIRRHPKPEAICWSWALEWNRKYRVIGFFGEQEPAEAIASNFPPLDFVTIAQGPKQHLSGRIETRLDEEKDNLFEWDSTIFRGVSDASLN